MDGPKTDILAGLDTIQWSQLHHAYGEASDVPAMLRDLLSPDKGKREGAFSDLGGTVCHQGTVYEATPYVVPFLLNVLEAPETPDKDAVVFLLASLADGYAYHEHVLGQGEYEQLWRDILAKDGRDLETEIAKERTWVAATRTAVGRGLHHLYEYLEHKEPAIREAIARALALYPEQAQGSLPPLRAALAAESDSSTRQEIEVAVQTLEGHLFKDDQSGER